MYEKHFRIKSWLGRFYYLCSIKKKMNMKRLIYIFLLVFGTLVSQAQESLPVKDFDGFILDMGTMLNAESLILLPPPMLNTLPFEWDEMEVSPYKLNPDAFKLTSNVTYMGGSDITNSRTSILSLLYNGVGSGMVNWQGTSYKLNNGMRINLHGEYDSNGRKVYNPSAMPWEKNNFNAAFEMKSANGNFGIKVEVHGGRNNPY